MFVLGVAFDSVVEGDGVHDVQQLTFVLVDTFHLKIMNSNLNIFQSVKNQRITNFGREDERVTGQGRIRNYGYVRLS